MKKNIYDMLNDVDINLDDYEIEEFNDIEKKKIKNNFRKNNNNKNSNKKIVVVASAAIIAFGLLGTDLGVYATEAIREVSYNIASAFNIEKNIDEYTTVVNKSVYKNGLTVTLNEVVLDNEDLIVSTTIKSDTKLDETGYLDLDGYIYINGEWINCSSGGGSGKIDDYTVEDVTTYKLGRIFNGDMNVKIKFKNGNLLDKKIFGTWTFEFKTNGDSLQLDTQEIKLDNKFTLENGQIVTLEKYTSNKIGQKIYFSKEGTSTDRGYDMILQGTDDLGNKVEFYITRSTSTYGIFKINNLEKSLDENATKLTLTPYAVKYPEQNGEMSNDYKKVGDPFVIDLTK